MLTMNPNVLLLSIDSLRHDRIFGDKKSAITPNIDKIIDNALDISTDLSEISKTINQSELDLIISNFKIFSNDLALILEKINDSNGTFSKLIENDTLFQNLNNASKSIDLLLEDIRLNPKRYIHFSIFGKKDKVYQSKSK